MLTPRAPAPVRTGLATTLRPAGPPPGLCAIAHSPFPWLFPRPLPQCQVCVGDHGSRSRVARDVPAFALIHLSLERAHRFYCPTPDSPLLVAPALAQARA